MGLFSKKVSEKSYQKGLDDIRHGIPRRSEMLQDLVAMLPYLPEEVREIYKEKTIEKIESLGLIVKDYFK